MHEASTIITTEAVKSKRLNYKKLAKALDGMLYCLHVKERTEIIKDKYGPAILVEKLNGITHSTRNALTALTDALREYPDCGLILDFIPRSDKKGDCIKITFQATSSELSPQQQCDKLAEKININSTNNSMDIIVRNVTEAVRGAAGQIDELQRHFPTVGKTLRSRMVKELTGLRKDVAHPPSKERI